MHVEVIPDVSLYVYRIHGILHGVIMHQCTRQGILDLSVVCVWGHRQSRGQIMSSANISTMKELHTQYLISSQALRFS